MFRFRWVDVEDRKPLPRTKQLHQQIEAIKEAIKTNPSNTLLKTKLQSLRKELGVSKAAI